MQSTHNATQPISGKFMEIACIFPLSACSNPDSAAVFDQAAQTASLAASLGRQGVSIPGSPKSQNRTILLAKVGFNTAENEALKVCQQFEESLKRV